MIRVKLPEAPQELLDKGAVDFAKARGHFGDTAMQGKSFTFGAYKLDPVKDALNLTFHFKCAYCESFFGATQPLDVEHFRPKSGVRVDDDLIWGVYYWLAGSWGNLLPSCTDCNRERRQTLPDGTRQTLGKANQFPISSEAKRAGKEGDERAEGRLLIHPSLDDPAKHLALERPTGSSAGSRGRAGSRSASMHSCGGGWCRRGALSRSRSERTSRSRAGSRESSRERAPTPTSRRCSCRSSRR